MVEDEEDRGKSEFIQESNDREKRHAYKLKLGAHNMLSEKIGESPC